MGAAALWAWRSAWSGGGGGVGGSPALALAAHAPAAVLLAFGSAAVPAARAPALRSCGSGDALPVAQAARAVFLASKERVSQKAVMLVQLITQSKHQLVSINPEHLSLML